ncbi:MAG: hypothetical protein ACLRSW_00935 [Christensenellaceae bacterium]
MLIHIMPKFNHFVNDFVFYKHKENEPILSTRFSLSGVIDGFVLIVKKNPPSPNAITITNDNAQIVIFFFTHFFYSFKILSEFVVACFVANNHSFCFLYQSFRARICFASPSAGVRRLSVMPLTLIEFHLPTFSSGTPSLVATARKFLPLQRLTEDWT